MAGNKFGAKKIIDPATGFVFDSKAEFIRWCELRIMERSGLISGLKRQVKYEVIPWQYDKGKVVERGCYYIADFEYVDRNGTKVVEDTKGYKKGNAYELFKIKRKLMLKVHGIRIKET